MEVTEKEKTLPTHSRLRKMSLGNPEVQAKVDIFVERLESIRNHLNMQFERLDSDNKVVVDELTGENAQTYELLSELKNGVKNMMKDIESIIGLTEMERIRHTDCLMEMIQYADKTKLVVKEVAVKEKMNTAEVVNFEQMMGEIIPQHFKLNEGMQAAQLHRLKKFAEEPEKRIILNNLWFKNYGERLIKEDEEG